VSKDKLEIFISPLLVTSFKVPLSLKLLGILKVIVALLGVSYLVLRINLSPSSVSANSPDIEL